MSVHLQLFEAEWQHDGPQPGAIPVRLPGTIQAWIRTLGAADHLASVEGGAPFATWLETIAQSGDGREELVNLDPLIVGALHATWGFELVPLLPRLVPVATRRDFRYAFGVRSAVEVESVIVAWGEVVTGALVRERGLIGIKA